MIISDWKFTLNEIYQCNECVTTLKVPVIVCVINSSFAVYSADNFPKNLHKKLKNSLLNLPSMDDNNKKVSKNHSFIAIQMKIKMTKKIIP